MIGTSVLRTILAMSVLCLLCSACTVKDPLYCDDRTLCEKGYQCNMSTNTCEAAADAGAGDAGAEGGAPDSAPKDSGDKDSGTDLATDLSGDLPGPDSGPDGPVADQAADVALPDAAVDLTNPADLSPDLASDTTSIDTLSPDTLSPDLAAPPKCGDGKKNGSDACDGADLGGKTCKGLGYASGTLKCTSKCALDTSGCVAAAKCGDGKINAAAEQCDKTNLGSKTCKTQGFTGGTISCTTGC